jgi:DNA topoisomerase IB
LPRLRRSDCSRPGLTRHGRGRGYEYRDPGGEIVRDPDVLDRVRALAIPPAWTRVWICLDPLGHLQATGTDAAGRKQYLYHEDWRVRRDREKFDRMLEFAERLPRLRRLTARMLEGEGLRRDRVLAGAVRLLDLGFFRIGSESYAEENDTFGLATMRKGHVRLAPGHALVFDYPAKGGRRRIQSVVDAAVYGLVGDLKRRRNGGELLAYRAGNRWVDVTSTDINEFIREHARGPFTAKDFRTWNATVLAAVALGVARNAAATPTGRKRAKSLAVQEVARYLGNTSAVCRSSYIDPRVFDRFDAGATIGPLIEDLGGEPPGEPRIQNRIDAAVRELLAGSGSLNGADPLRSERGGESARVSRPVRPRAAADVRPQRSARARRTERPRRARRNADPAA